MHDALKTAIALVLVLGFYIAIFWFLIRILHRLGLSGWWSLFIFLWPIGLGMLAFSRWPAFDRKSS